jgi:hypothetical protein
LLDVLFRDSRDSVDVVEPSDVEVSSDDFDVLTDADVVGLAVLGAALIDVGDVVKGGFVVVVVDVVVVVVDGNVDGVDGVVKTVDGELGGIVGGVGVVVVVVGSGQVSPSPYKGLSAGTIGRPHRTVTFASEERNHEWTDVLRCCGTLWNECYPQFEIHISIGSY